MIHMKEWSQCLFSLVAKAGFKEGHVPAVYLNDDTRFVVPFVDMTGLAKKDWHVCLDEKRFILAIKNMPFYLQLPLRCGSKLINIEPECFRYGNNRTVYHTGYSVARTEWILLGGTHPVEEGTWSDTEVEGPIVIEAKNYLMLLTDGKGRTYVLSHITG